MAISCWKNICSSQLHPNISNVSFFGTWWSYRLKKSADLGQQMGWWNMTQYFTQRNRRFSRNYILPNLYARVRKKVKVAPLQIIVHSDRFFLYHAPGGITNLCHQVFLEPLDLDSNTLVPLRPKVNLWDEEIYPSTSSDLKPSRRWPIQQISNIWIRLR